ncbi:hypothetical protein GGD63_007138 [Bradyrhizobium sp. cir1]|uniref:hypothetical protein n=1 Tax=Bradyrhizobium sp. cir1 TaxID=1445730 RepID=UPI001605E6B7|nr:hypothetical protein [Bradyrhizobium sp. cir1]MBB4374308.1 hypothetical protein [Bradyrhizobium sp. cir1]
MGRTTRVPYLVSGTNEYGSANLGRGSATVALRLARKLLRDGYMDVRICTPRGRVLQADELSELEPQESDMAKGQQRSNREAKKPKKDKAKVIAAAPSRKEAAWQPDFGPGKKK